jgi:transposase
VKWRDGCFAQDAVGDWWLCVPVTVTAEQTVAPLEAVGIDLGLKTIATTSDGEKLEAGRWTQGHAVALANAQRRGHKRQAKRIHRKAANQRKDALHKFSRKIVDSYQTIVVGDVSSTNLRRPRWRSPFWIRGGACSRDFWITRASRLPEVSRSSTKVTPASLVLRAGRLAVRVG